MVERERYTWYPRAILWLLQGGGATIGDDEADARPRFEVEVAPFYIGKHPISNVQFEAFRPDYQRAEVSPGDDDPAVGINHTDATGYCEWFSAVSRKSMRLPTEIEWEYACRGGSQRRWFFGEDPALAERFVLHAGNCRGDLRPLGQTRPNPYGLIGMLGGVWEWTSSIYLPYPARDGDGRDDPERIGPRVLRGGSFRVPIDEIGAAVRRGEDPGFAADDIGFRIVRSFA